MIASWPSGVIVISFVDPSSRCLWVMSPYASSAARYPKGSEAIVVSAVLGGALCNVPSSCARGVLSWATMFAASGVSWSLWLSCCGSVC